MGRRCAELRFISPTYEPEHIQIVASDQFIPGRLSFGTRAQRPRPPANVVDMLSPPVVVEQNKQLELMQKPPQHEAA